MLELNKKYNIIYADPPWKYQDKSKSHGGGAENHYPCMNISDICDLPIQSISSENCVLFLWVTMPMLQEGLRVIDSWGFTYKTMSFVWVKANKRENTKQLSVLYKNHIDDYMGMGRWTRANAELCMLGTKGKIERRSKKVRQIIYSSVEGHSKKPEETKDRIIELVGDLPRIELFARQKTEGWDSWGNELN